MKNLRPNIWDFAFVVKVITYNAKHGIDLIK